MSTNIDTIRADFPILSQTVYGKPLVYLDNGATTQKPQVVIDTLIRMYSEMNANIHRGVHFLSEQATRQYEEARNTVRDFIHAAYSQEIIFTSGATAGINAIAFSYGERFIRPGDDVLLTTMEHHSNIVPWQMMCARKQARLKVIPISEQGELILEEFARLLSPRTRIVALTHVSNTLGTINPVEQVIRMAHLAGAHVLVDGAQAVQHMPVDVQKLDCDFYVFSGHKLFGPTGTGVLYGKSSLLNELPPYQGGGDMVDCVRFEGTTYNELPFKFEAGTSNYVDATALQSAIKYVSAIGMEQIAAYETSLMHYAREQLQTVPGIRMYGTAPLKTAVFSFVLGDHHPYDVGMILDKMGIAVRTGTHCTQPLMDFLGITGTIRASFALYNTFEEVDQLVAGLHRAGSMLQ
jgi:cysteine desulfurase/selenocysteine lyase